uniref:BHLH domain-containing protein n=1 Tax=Ascaris lumbricoides TaxID=6252 RepID=A0A0M3I837_ASCLU
MTTKSRRIYVSVIQGIQKEIPEIRIKSVSATDRRSSDTQRHEQAAKTIQAFYRKLKNTADKLHLVVVTIANIILCTVKGNLWDSDILFRAIHFMDVVMDILEKKLHNQLKLSSENTQNENWKHQEESGEDRP